MNEAQLVVAEKRKHAALADILVETGMAETEKKKTDNNQPSSNPVIKVEAIRNRVNESSWRHHFGKLFWDSTITLFVKRAACLLCQVLYKQYRACKVFDYILLVLS